MCACLLLLNASLLLWYGGGGGCCSVENSCSEINAIWQLVNGGVVVAAILVQGGVLASKLLRRQTGSASLLRSSIWNLVCIVGCNASTTKGQEVNSKPQGQALFHSPSDQVIACTPQDSGKEEERSIG